MHQFYLEIELEKMQCYCEQLLRMSQSQSEKKPWMSLLHLPQTYSNCKFFQRVDQTPSKKVRAWLLENQHPSNHAGYPRPYELYKPGGQNQVSNWIRQLSYEKQSNQFCDEQIARDHVIPKPC